MYGDEFQDEEEFQDRRIPRLKIEKPPKKMAGVGFYMIVILVAFKDFLFDPISDIFVVTSILALIVGPIVSFIVTFYMFYSGVSFTNKKLAAILVPVVVEAIPLVSIIPTQIISLFIVRHLENKEQEEKFKKKMASIKRQLKKEIAYRAAT